MENLTIAPTAPHTHTIILLHDVDSFASDFASKTLKAQASSALKLREIFPSIKWVFPQANIWFSVNAPPQWFHVRVMENELKERVLRTVGLNPSFQQILDIVDEEAKVLHSYHKVLLGGVGMGCAVGILALLQGANQLGGFIGISGWLPFCHKIEEIGNGSPRNITRALRSFKRSFYHDDGDEDRSLLFEGLRTPIFLAHSEYDAEVPVSKGLQMGQALLALWRKTQMQQVSVDLRVYDGDGHGIVETRVVDDIVGFVGGVLGLGNILKGMREVSVKGEGEGGVSIKEEGMIKKEEVMIKKEEDFNMQKEVFIKKEE